jgi:hypothetical protein
MTKLTELPPDCLQSLTNQIHNLLDSDDTSAGYALHSAIEQWNKLTLGMSSKRIREVLPDNDNKNND